MKRPSAAGAYQKNIGEIVAIIENMKVRVRGYGNEAGSIESALIENLRRASGGKRAAIVRINIARRARRNENSAIKEEVTINEAWLKSENQPSK